MNVNVSFKLNGIKKTIDNRVRYIPIGEKTKEKEVKPKTIKVGSLPRKQNKNFSTIIQNLLKILQREDLEYSNE